MSGDFLEREESSNEIKMGLKGLRPFFMAQARPLPPPPPNVMQIDKTLKNSKACSTSWKFVQKFKLLLKFWINHYCGWKSSLKEKESFSIPIKIYSSYKIILRKSNHSLNLNSAYLKITSAGAGVLCLVGSDQLSKIWKSFNLRFEQDLCDGINSPAGSPSTSCEAIKISRIFFEDFTITETNK